MGIEAELVLDIVQFALDVGGIVEPTPFCDATSGLIALARGQWLDAVINGASMLPYVGDLAKIGKLPKYAQSIAKAIALAAKDEKFAARLRPALEKLLEALKKVPIDKLPADARGQMQQIKMNIEAFLDGAKKLWKSQLLYPTQRIYQGIGKHGSGPTHGVKGSPMDLNDGQAADLLKSALYDVTKGLGDKAPTLWGYRNGKIYRFHYDNLRTWHGFPDTVKPPDFVLQQWRSTGHITNAEFNRLRKLPNSGF